jgi:triosephosphate isomerase
MRSMWSRHNCTARFPTGPPDFVIAYEPVWAIGTGLTPTIADVAEMHRAIRTHLVSRCGVAGREARVRGPNRGPFP